MTVNLDDVQRAAERTQEHLVRTPCLHSATLSKLTGCELYIKFENHQFTAAFKERGALNRLLQLSEDERRRGVIAMSAGNHAQAVAYHAARLGIHATIVMPRHTPNLKVRNTRNFGAEVHLEGNGVDDAGAYAQRLATERDLVFVHPYDDEHIIAGQGTIALEMLEDVPDLDSLVVPIGGGGLISGNAVAAKALRPDIEVVGVQTQRFPAMKQALAGEPVHCGLATLAEGIAVKQPGELTRELVRELVSDITLVDEPEIERAILMLLEIEKTVAEGAGAAGLAALLTEPERYRGRKVGLVLCGGNIDMLALSSVIQRGLVRTGRIVRVRVGISDVPGALSELTNLLAEQRANVITIAHQRTFTDLSLRATEVEATLETLGREHTRDVIEALRAEGYDPVLPANEVHPDERWADDPEGHGEYNGGD
ncbi:threonine ammonia-lyase [Halomonas elongata]|uniref:threonine ammonia-lyase n=1 Tax=Halomonas elongata TaxID=2746 RepID=UPI0023B1BC46|nr:threonine ammonia-lyase [Halomonas elongata]